MTLITKRHQGFAWHHRGAAHAKGYLFDGSDVLCRGAATADYFAVNDADAFRRALIGANGSFAVILETASQVLAAVDRVRSIPLFYAMSGGCLLLGDDVLAIQDALGGTEVDPIAREAFLRIAYTVGPTTLDPRVRQIEAGEFFVYDKIGKQSRTECYFRHSHGAFTVENDEPLLDELDAITSRWARRLIASVRGRMIVIPLSGGYDSRYIACALKREGYPHVACYSYGVPASFEHRIAAQVATQLGYPIHVVEYGRDRWQAIIDAPDFPRFCQFASQRCSVAHLQDLPALDALQGSGVFQSDAVIVPGFCGDLQGGSRIPEGILAGRAKALLAGGIDAHILHTCSRPRTAPIDPNLERALLEQIHAYTRQFMSDDLERFCSVNEDWFTRHKVAKFVVNSLRTYEWFGYEWRLPLWDNELIEWWYRIPLRLRIRSTFYHRFLFERLFGPMDVAFRKPHSRGRFRVMAMQWLPPSAIPPLNRASKRVLAAIGLRPQDIDGFEALSSILTARLPASGRTDDHSDVNSAAAAWYIAHGL